MMPRWAIVARWALVLALPVVLVTGVVRLVMTPAYLRLAYVTPGFPADAYGMTTSERLAYGPLAVNYLLNNEDITWLAALRIPRDRVPPDVCVVAPEDAAQCALFNTRELTHLDDVKVVSRATFALGWGALALCVLCGGALAWRPATRGRLRAALFGAGALTLGVMLTLGLTALIAWETFFVGFHTLFFAGDSWLFRYSDTLIRLYPEGFWLASALLIVVLVAVGAVALLLLGGWSGLRGAPMERQPQTGGLPQ